MSKRRCKFERELRKSLRCTIQELKVQRKMDLRFGEWGSLIDTEARLDIIDYIISDVLPQVKRGIENESK